MKGGLVTLRKPVMAAVGHFAWFNYRTNQMGVNFTAIFDHTFDVEGLLELPNHLNRSWRQIQPFLPIIPGYPVSGATVHHGWQWKQFPGQLAFERELANHGCLMLEGPEGFWGVASNKAFEICHGCKWWHFLTDELVRQKLRAVCQIIGKVVVSDWFIVLPDSFYECSGVEDLMFDSKGVAEMLVWLQAKCGPPALTCSDITDDNEDWGGNRYFVELVESPNQKRKK